MNRPDPAEGWPLDITTRLGWLHRSHRASRDVSLRSMTARLEGIGVPASIATLSRVESGRRWRVDITRGYETLLGLPRGQIESTVAMLARTFPGVPSDSTPTPPRPDLATFSAVCATVDGGRATGGDWLEFADLHDHPAAGFGVPDFTMARSVQRLTAEMIRSLGVAYTSRYEALCRLRTGRYREVTAQTLRSVVEDDDYPVRLDAVSALTEIDDPVLVAPLVRWAVSLLSDGTAVQVRMAGVALVNLLARELALDDPAWAEVAPAIVRAAGRCADDEAAAYWLATVCAGLSPALRAAVPMQVRRTLPRIRAPRGWDERRSNPHYALVRGIVERVTDGVSGVEDELLTRLLFELLFDHRDVRTTTSAALLVASPFQDAIFGELLALAGHPEATVRAGAMGCLARIQTGHETLATVPRWDPRYWLDGLSVTGHAGHPVPGPVRAQLGTLGPETDRRIVYSAGMAADPWLSEVASDATLGRPARVLARWWLDAGGRVLT